MNRIKFFVTVSVFTMIGAVLCSDCFSQLKEPKVTERIYKDALKEEVVYKETEPFIREREVIIKQLEIITGDEENRYIIIPGDTLDITFTDRSETKTAIYQVSSNGDIHMPLIGAVKVSSLTRKQLREKLNAYLGEYIRNPNVDIQVNVSGRYMIAGEVTSPGVYRIRANLTVMEAILAAGYDKDEVNLKSVMVMGGMYDKPVVKRLNLDKMMKKGDRSENIFVKPGDVIYVSKRFIGDIEKFIETVYRYVKAYYGLGRIPSEPKPVGDEPDQVFFE